MLAKKEKVMECDVLVIGGGGAGLRAAIAAADQGVDVLMVSKARIGHATNTYLSKAIVASSGWGDAGDNSDVHSNDTLAGGRYLNNPDMVSRFTGAIRSETELLQKWGVEFNTDETGKPAVFRIPGHTHARHIAGRNWKGSDLIFPMKRKAVDSGVRFLEKIAVSKLVVSGNRVCGATAVSEDGIFTAIEAKSVILATGGYARVFLNTNNAPGITGDGHALAFDVGAAMQDMEFVQYYPTALGKRGNRILLYDRLLAQEGVILKNSRGEDILKKNGYNVPSNITRDLLAQVIMKEIINDTENSAGISMDLEGLAPEAAKELSMLLPSGWQQGIRVFQITPTAHFCMGGVVVDASGETSCQALFAAGEVTAGAHGANRLGGNALAEVIAMGSLVGKAAANKARSLVRAQGFAPAVQKERERLEALFEEQGPRLRAGELIQELKQAMWFNAGIVRDRQSLEKALEVVTGQKDYKVLVETPSDLVRLLELRNMRLVGEMVCRAAIERTESRGSHFRSDFPRENDDAWRKNIQIKKTDSGMALEATEYIM
ncbi:MAG: FAD-dependent oxidoreductase [Pseudomonadota bacterium]